MDLIKLELPLFRKQNMSKVIAIAVTFLVIGSDGVVAQDVQSEKTENKKTKQKKDSGKIKKTDKNSAVVKYRRSSLHTMIIEDEKLPKKDILLKSFYDAEFPDKYNNHTVGDKSFKLSEYFVKPLIVEGEKKKKRINYDPTIEKYFKDNKVANSIVAKWFGRNEQGAFNMNLIGERGAYDASAQDAVVASSTERGISALSDAGEELIPNTFVVVNYSKFISNEVAAKAVKDIAYDAVKDKPEGDLVRDLAEKLADKVYEKTKDGYSVWTTAYLYQLTWNDSISSIFYNDLWIDESSLDPAKKEAFDKSDLFQLELLGFERAKALITGSGKNSGTDTLIIRDATNKSINSVYNKLQRKFESFRTKTPLYSANPLGAKIGLKEGLEPGDKYEVLEQSIDETGKVKYKRKGVIKVNKKGIWNNMYNAGEKPVDENGDPIKLQENLEYTLFKGGKGYYPGMLIRQIN